MKKIFLLSIPILINACLFSQNIIGNWKGSLPIANKNLKLEIHIELIDDQLNATWDSPDQNFFNGKVDSISFVENKLFFKIKPQKIEYSGFLYDTIIKGTFTQASQVFPLNFSKSHFVKIIRKQTPKPPFNYNTEEVIIENTKAKLSLKATLNYPKGNKVSACVIFITGSGIQDRDETIMEHKPFAVIADYLAERGIASLRCDDRDYIDYQKSTLDNFASDVYACLDYLKARPEIDNNNIGLIGHSMGGAVAQIAASKSKNIKFVILLAAPCINGDSLLISQTEAVLISENIDINDINIIKSFNSEFYEIAKKNNKKKIPQLVKNNIEKNYNNLPDFQKKQLSKNMLINQATVQLMSTDIYELIRFTPKKYLKKIKSKVIAFFAEKDIQVPAKNNILALNSLIKQEKKSNIEIKEMKGLNHLFQHCNNCTISEYALLEETISEDLLSEIYNFIKNYNGN